MRYVSPKFDVDVEIDIEPNGTEEMPSLDDRSLIYNLFGNIDFEEAYVLPSVEDACFEIEREREYLLKIFESDNYEDEEEEIFEEIGADFELPNMDLGIIGAVSALGAVGCFTGASCNGGAFGSFHSESHPLVVFIAKDSNLNSVVECAREVGAGLFRDENGAIVLYADRIEPMIEFGPCLLKKLRPELSLDLPPLPSSPTADFSDL